MAHRIPGPAKHGKATIAASCTALEQIPNIGVSLAADLRSIGIVEPHDLIGRDPYGLFVALCERSGQRQDCCVLDSFMAATDFMAGAAPSPWWQYTARRKAVYGQLGVPETAWMRRRRPFARPRPMPHRRSGGPRQSAAVARRDFRAACGWRALRANGADPVGGRHDPNPAELLQWRFGMLKMLWSPLQRWWRTEGAAPHAPLPQVFRRPARAAARVVERSPGRARQPLTPFAVRPGTSRAVHGARRAAQRFWMTLDPQDRRRAAIGGSFAQVCAALERLAALEEQHAG